MKRLEEIMVEYAREKGGGLPLTPQEMCNAVVLWVQEKLLGEVKETYPSFEADKGVDIEHNEVDNHYVFSLDTEYVQSIIPEVNAETLLSLFEGSETIVVDLNEDGNKIEFHLDGEVVNKLSRALLTPVQNPIEVELVAIGTDGSQVNIPISEVVGGGTQSHTHRIEFEFAENGDWENDQIISVRFNIINTRDMPYSDLLEASADNEGLFGVIVVIAPDGVPRSVGCIDPQLDIDDLENSYIYINGTQYEIKYIDIQGFFDYITD